MLARLDMLEALYRKPTFEEALRRLERLERLERSKRKAALEDVKLEREATALEVHLQQSGS